MELILFQVPGRSLSILDRIGDKDLHHSSLDIENLSLHFLVSFSMRLFSGIQLGKTRHSPTPCTYDVVR